MNKTKQAILYQQALNRKFYANDTRYQHLKIQMDLLGITDVTTNRQHKNGTVVWQLPITSRYDKNRFLEYASFDTGYVRNQGVECHSNYQVNKQVSAKPQYFELPNGDYRKYEGVERVLIPVEIDRLEYMIKYVIKNEFIKRANSIVQGGNYVPKWKLEQVATHTMNCKNGAQLDLENKLATINRISNITN